MSRQVVITGMGTVNPLGNTVQETWSNCLEGKSGIGPITQFDTTDFACKIAGEVKNLDIDAVVSPKDQRKMARFIQLTMVAAHEAWQASGLEQSKFDPARLGTLVGVGMGGLPEIEHWKDVLNEKGPKRISPFFIPLVIPNLASGHLSIKYNAKGPNNCTVTACASSTHAIGEGTEYIRRNAADIMIVGGSESVICPLGVGGFSVMRALSTRNHEPEKASRPFDKDRDGFVMGEGSAIMILEEKEHALKRGAEIYGEVVGYALNADAFHLTAPSEDGNGGKRCMELAIENAKANSDLKDKSQIGYVNAHGTSTPVGDMIELRAIREVFGESAETLNVSSSKSMTGHLLGAAGALEGMVCVLSLMDQKIPPTINVDNLDPEATVNVTPNKLVEKEFEYALSNSFGFGGTNGCLIFKKV